MTFFDFRYNITVAFTMKSPATDSQNSDHRWDHDILHEAAVD